MAEGSDKKALEAMQQQVSPMAIPSPDPRMQQQVPPMGVPAPDPRAAVPVVVTPAVLPVTQPPEDVPSYRKKNCVEAYLLWLVFGLFGGHHFYLRRYGWGILYLFTLGLLGAGFVFDLFRIPMLVKRSNKQRIKPKDKTYVGDAYTLWMPLGLFGAHHFYLKNWGWAVTYLFTFGLGGMGWFMDLFLMHSMVEDYNSRAKAAAAMQNMHPGTQTAKVAEYMAIRKKKTKSSAYRLCLFPLGLLGAHHYYLGRIAFGLFYTFTLGGLGVGWFVDIFRLWALVKDANERIRDGKGFKERRLDDCYVMAIPLGLFGAHHFYLRRVGWGFLYFFTVGCLGIGWIVDLFRMYKLVRTHNEKVAAQRRQLESANVSGQVNPNGPAQYVTVVPPPQGPGAGNAQIVENIAPGSYMITPAPAYTVVPGVQPPVLPQIPPGYGATDYTSWSTIASSEVDQPPSYEYTQNLQNFQAVNTSVNSTHPQNPSCPDEKTLHPEK